MLSLRHRQASRRPRLDPEPLQQSRPAHEPRLQPSRDRAAPQPEPDKTPGRFGKERPEGVLPKETEGVEGPVLVELGQARVGAKPARQFDQSETAEQVRVLKQAAGLPLIAAQT